jgi:hypothetical protein
MSEDIRKALAALDVNDDLDWTSDGAPSLLALSALLGREVTRKEIAESSVAFSRKNPSVVKPKPKAKKPKAEKPQDVDDEAALRKDVESARLIANKANADLKKAVEKLDAVIVAKEREARRIGPANAIKQYQQSQAAQRAIEAAKK